MNTDSLLKLNPPDQFADVGVCQSTKVPIKLCYNIFYPPTSHNNSGVETLPVILLIQGLSSPGLFFDNQFCRALSNHNNKRCAVIRFDNRDIGKSTFIEPKTNNHNNNAQNTGSSSGTILQYAYAMVNPSKRYSIHSLYTIDDMAKDALGLLTALEKKEQENNNNNKKKSEPRLDFSKVHLFGVCMGGIIAQQMVLRQPQKFISLTLFGSHLSEIGSKIDRPNNNNNNKNNNNKNHKSKKEDYGTRWPSIKDCLLMVRFIPRESVSKKFQKKCDEIQQNTKLSKKEKETLLIKVNQEKTYYRAKLYTECFYNFANSISGEHQNNTVSEKPSFRILPDPKYNSNNNIQTPFYIVVPQTKNGKANFALDKEKCQKQFLRVFLRSGRLIDNAPRQYGALLTAPPRGAKLAATITSQRPNNNTTNTNNKYYLPTSIIQGTRDPLCPYENAFALQDAIEGSALFSVLGLGHVLHPSLRDVFVTVIWQSMEEGERFYKTNKNNGKGDPTSNNNNNKNEGKKDAKKNIFSVPKLLRSKL